jgi:hypothetical protein
MGVVASQNQEGGETLTAIRVQGQAQAQHLPYVVHEPSGPSPAAMYGQDSSDPGLGLGLPESAGPLFASEEGPQAEHEKQREDRNKRDRLRRQQETAHDFMKRREATNERERLKKLKRDDKNETE